MPSDDAIGKLFRMEDAMVVEWEIANFSTLSGKVDAEYFSPVFTFSDACWSLHIYPNGRSKHPEFEDYVSLYVHLVGKCAHPVDATLCFMDVKGKEQYRRDFTHTFEEDTGSGYPQFCRRSEVMGRDSILLSANVLTVRCTLKNLNRRPVRDSLFERLLKVSRNMKAILKGGKRSDVVLKLKGRNLQAHRAILETGSEVFAAMFTHDMAENRTGEVSIEDVDADVFQQILSYMYSGQVDDLCVGNVFKLYEAADKYDLDELKELCTTFMEENMSADLFCNVVVLADKHNDTKLLKFAKEFFTKNSVISPLN